MKRGKWKATKFTLINFPAIYFHLAREINRDLPYVSFIFPFFPICSHDFLMIFLDVPIFSYGFPMIFPICSYIFPMVFPWFSPGFSYDGISYSPGPAQGWPMWPATCRTHHSRSGFQSFIVVIPWEWQQQTCRKKTFISSSWKSCRQMSNQPTQMKQFSDFNRL